MWFFSADPMSDVFISTSADVRSDPIFLLSIFLHPFHSAIQHSVYLVSHCLCMHIGVMEFGTSADFRS